MKQQPTSELEKLQKKKKSEITGENEDLKMKLQNSGKNEI